MRMKNRVRLTILFLAALMAIPTGNINAIPAFARKYQISCQVCHSPAAPALKPFGDEFAGNGFRMTEYEAPRHYIETGDESLSLFRELPLAIRLDGFATLNFNNEGDFDFAAPFVVKLLSGGEISKKLSYYFYFLFNERGSVAGLEDAFLMYRDLFKTGINIYVGQFQASDPLFKGELRLTLEPYQIYASSPEYSTIDLKYDRGVMFDKGFSTGTTIVAEIVNGSGLGEADEFFVFDKDRYKNFMGRITQDIGKSLSVGFFGYSGKEIIDAVTGPFTSSVVMYGPDLSLNINNKLIFRFQYVMRTDSEVYTEEPENLQDAKTSGGFGELTYAPKGDLSKWYLTGLVNWVESDLDYLDYSSATMHAGYLLRRNVRLVTEYTYLFSGEYGRLSAGFVSAF